MTVKEFKELLECLIEEGKGDYTVFVNDLPDEYEIYINDIDKEVCL